MFNVSLTPSQVVPPVTILPCQAETHLLLAFSTRWPSLLLHCM
jgi:hypothetical protein